MTRSLTAPGAKSRLAEALGAPAASRLHAAMAAHVARQLRLLRATDGVNADVWVTGGSPREASRSLTLPAHEQGSGDLGERQLRVLRYGLRHSVVASVIGSDCPTVDAEDMRRALAAAAAGGVALVPAADGGYCLLAVRRDTSAVLHPAFEGVPWGTADVCRTLVERLGRAGVEPVLLPERADVDRPEDLPAWEAVRREWCEPPRSLSVVVPTLNEAAVLPALLERLAEERIATASAGGALEVIVTDGGSTDGTAGLAEDAGLRVVGDGRGRAAQMNAGAGWSAGDALVFVHADTLPPPGFAASVLDALTDPELLVGAFRFSLGAQRPALRLIEACTRLRGSVLRFPYGDQALFCRRAVWRVLGGFPSQPVMEDYEFVRRARRAGLVRVLPEDALTSDRRWRENGAWRWTARNLGTLARYHLGWSPQRLAEWRGSSYSKR